MVDRNVKEPLDLVGVQVHRDDAVDSHGLQHVGRDLGSDGHARLVFPVLAREAEIRNHGDDLVRGSALGGVNHQEQFHQVVAGRERGLHDKHVFASHGFIE